MPDNFVRNVLDLTTIFVSLFFAGVTEHVVIEFLDHLGVDQWVKLNSDKRTC